LTNFSSFSVTPSAASAEQNSLHRIALQRVAMELILSWNVELAARSSWSWKRGHFTRSCHSLFQLGVWSANPAANPPRSTVGQKNEDGDVLTDTLRLSAKASAFKFAPGFRWSAGGWAGRLKVCGSCSIGRAAQSGSDSEQAASGAWGKKLSVPELSQMAYPGGEVWCSPAATAMVLGYWGQALARDDLHPTVPAVAQAIYDRNWPGHRELGFNTAYAGAFPGMRLTSPAWLMFPKSKIGSPGMSRRRVRFPMASFKAKPKKGDGHLVVCAGFTPDGQMIINDPGTRSERPQS